MVIHHSVTPQAKAIIASLRPSNRKPITSMSDLKKLGIDMGYVIGKSIAALDKIAHVDYPINAPEYAQKILDEITKELDS